jgi:hypothetical protein
VREPLEREDEEYAGREIQQGDPIRGQRLDHRGRLLLLEHLGIVR